MKGGYVRGIEFGLEEEFLYDVYYLVVFILFLIFMIR